MKATTYKQKEFLNSGCVVADPEVTPFWSYFLVGGDPPGIRFSSATSNA
jgi:hypothetical protein